MGTSLKRSKKIRVFCYRMFATALLITAIISAVIGREALVNWYACSFHPNSLKGELYYLGEFRDHINRLYNQAMVGHAGIGDNMGYPLTDSYAVEYSAQSLSTFYGEMEKAGGDIIYYIRDAEGKESSNVSYPLFSEYDGHLLLPENVQLCCYWDGATESLFFFDDSYEKYRENHYQPNKEAARGIELVLAVKDDCTSERYVQLEAKAREYGYALRVIVIALCGWLFFGFLGLCSGRAARRAKEEYAKVSSLLWMEVKLLLAALVIYASCAYQALWMYFIMGCYFYLFYTDVKYNGIRVLVNSLPVKTFYYIREYVRGVPWYRRMLSLCTLMLWGGILLLTVGVGMIIAPNLMFGTTVHGWIWFLYIGSGIMVLTGILLLCGFLRQRKLLKDVKAVVVKISEMKEGKVKVPLLLSKHSLIAQVAQDLNELENGIESAVEQQNRSNKMKVELLTNVSHDLKTPLTSIINYADLLCEETLPEPASEYAVALQGKAYRLKHMVQDVFDLSKATSGNLTVEKAVIDLVKLIQQTLADMDERIQESNLIFKLQIAQEPLFIEADGEKLYRVFQNLFVNALQYSLDHSRVHVQLSKEDGFAMVKVKNTSRTELNFDTHEIVERFVRADSSRSSEGSGLGLSIVQSFAEACGGQFLIETDADMFTACVKFPLVQREETIE